MAGSLGDLLAKAGLKAGPEVDEPAAADEPVEEGPPVLPDRIGIRYGKRKGTSGKVTVVTGLVADQVRLLRQLRAELGVGGRVDAADLILQGDQLERVARWFEGRGVAKVQRNRAGS
jgi:translation initiation factor 1 (eIF-1/SUI1)